MGEFILASLKDIGGLNNLLPVIQELDKRGRRVEIIASAGGVAAEVLKKNGAQFILGDDAVKVVNKFSNPRLLITSTCSTNNIGRDLVSLLRNTRPIVAIQDYWGEGLTNRWNAPEYRPHYITVNDQLGAELVKMAWPEFEPSHIWQTGFPMADAYSGIDGTDAVKARTEILTRLNKRPDSTIIFFPAGNLAGASQFLSDILEIIHDYHISNKPRRPMILIPRYHPTLKKEANMKHEVELWERAISKFEDCRPGVVVIDETVVRADIKTLLLASDLVISDYSTTLLEAGFVGARLEGKPNISACYIPEIARDMKTNIGPLLIEPPPVTLGCSAKAKDKMELHDLITVFLNNDNNTLKNDLVKKQKKYLKTDGQNSKRVADLIETLL